MKRARSSAERRTSSLLGKVEGVKYHSSHVNFSVAPTSKRPSVEATVDMRGALEVERGEIPNLKGAQRGVAALWKSYSALSQ